ncbi:MAG: tRNA preQ1(34) S-adenosylmethionine ribosyltransferase-isomerase QueA [Bdellovibrionales bacterium]
MADIHHYVTERVDLPTSAFDFPLPSDRIAQAPCSPRDAARLLHVRQDGFADSVISALPDLLKAGDVLVMNNTRVIPARLYGQRGAVRVEVLLHKDRGQYRLRRDLSCYVEAEWMAFARPGKRLHVGDTISFAEKFVAVVLDKGEDGEIALRLSWPSSKQDSFSIESAKASLFALMERYGEPPLPPYIKREKGLTQLDRTSYQTIYAKRDGAIAAPTAGLHFTPELLARLDQAGFARAFVTLHVGAGTFQPVKAERVSEHVMHKEWGEIDVETAKILNDAKREGRRIVAVGTTSLRLLESAAMEQGALNPFAGETGIFISPGYRFRFVDALLTNFHLPRSTLFMLVSAFAGLERMQSAYAHAVAKGYRFYSYGDACLLERDEVSSPFPMNVSFT